MSTRGARGRIGERQTAVFLRKKGYQILAANYHSRFGEIDIIASKKKYIAFVEVKTRGQNAIARPCESVDYKKQERIKQTVLMYLSINKTELQPRFDVAEVILDDNNKLVSINYIENAFE